MILPISFLHIGFLHIGHQVYQMEMSHCNHSNTLPMLLTSVAKSKVNSTFMH